MFTSPLEIVAMPCGHYLHHACYTALMLSTYQCPICKRSAVNMETQWRKLEEEIRHQPMPREWSDVKVEVKCNDCAALSVAAFHWLGVKCGRCDGFNTSTVRMMAENEEVRRDVVEFAEARRERRSELSRENFRRTVTAPLTVRPYFLDDAGALPGRPRSSFGGAEGFQNPFTLPELPRLHDFSGRLPNINLAEYRDRFPNIPYPSMPTGFAFPFDLGVMERVGRGLSPIRHYFDDQIVEGVPRQFRRDSRGQVAEDAEVEGSWKGNESWMVGSSDDEEEGEEYESEEDEEDEEDGEGDSDEEMADVAGLMEEEDEDEGGGFKIELTGHR
jgi:phage FluMu protein Com